LITFGVNTLGGLIKTSAATTVIDEYARFRFTVPASLETLICPTAPALSGNRVIVVAPFTSTVPVNAVPCTVIEAVGVCMFTSPPSFYTLVLIHM